MDNIVKFGDICGLPVYNQDGKETGYIKDMLLNTEKKEVEGFQLDGASSIFTSGGIIRTEDILKIDDKGITVIKVLQGKRRKNFSGNSNSKTPKNASNSSNNGTSSDIGTSGNTNTSRNSSTSGKGIRSGNTRTSGNSSRSVNNDTSSSNSTSGNNSSSSKTSPSSSNSTSGNNSSSGKTSPSSSNSTSGNCSTTLTELRSKKLMSNNDEEIGVVSDVIFNAETGAIESFIISSGLLQDIFDGRQVMPLIGKVEFSEELIRVGRDSIEEMHWTGGGLKNRSKKK